MKIAFRSDASLQIGTGHFMRCLALADVLRQRGAQCNFICRPSHGHLLNLIQERGHKANILVQSGDAFSASADLSHAKLLSSDWASDAKQTQQTLGRQVVDWLVVDHYALDERWEHALRPHARRILVIDDLADRPHDCDLLLDQNLGREPKDYVGLLSSKTKTLIGPSYALLRPEFSEWREHSLQRREKPKLTNLLITMGGVDLTNVTGQVLDALTICDLPADLRITVVVGPMSLWLAKVQAQAASMPRPTQVLVGVSNMAQLMAESDLCIGAAGGTAWERCALGLPTIVLILAANQNSGAMALQAHGAAWTADDLEQLRTQMITMFNIDKQTVALQKLSQAAARVTQGDGVSRVLESIFASNA